MKILRNLAVILISAALLCVIPVTGCAPIDESSDESSMHTSTSSASEGPMNCVIIYANRSNSQNSEAAMTEAAKYIRGVKEVNGYLNFVRLDGQPVALSADAQTTTEHDNETRIKKENDEFVSEKLDELDAITAIEPEVDVLEAVEVANNELGSAQDETLENVVVIIGSGLSTAGVINFATLDINTTDLTDYESWIESQGLLTKLGHIDKIVWYGFDMVDEPQQKFSTPVLELEVQNFYRTIFEKAGVASVEFEPLSTVSDSKDTDNEDLPPVTVVQMPPTPQYASGLAVEVPADVLFTPDQATFLNGANPADNSKIRAIAEYVKNNHLKLTITGYVAHYGTPEQYQGLSLARAEALKKVLVDELGCPAENITAVGGGFGPYGEGSPEIDQKNRCVVFSIE